MTFLVVALNTHARTAKLTTRTLQPCPTQQKFSQKMPSSYAWGRYLQLTPINYAKNIFLALHC